jgi:hypothetical protein
MYQVPVFPTVKSEKRTGRRGKGERACEPAVSPIRPSRVSVSLLRVKHPAKDAANCTPSAPSADARSRRGDATGRRRVAPGQSFAASPPISLFDFSRCSHPFFDFYSMNFDWYEHRKMKQNETSIFYSLIIICTFKAFTDALTRLPGFYPKICGDHTRISVSNCLSTFYQHYFSSGGGWGVADEGHGRHEMAEM